ncbi:ribosomal protein S18-alanine N-acetyltransferase [Dethiobacter alkaliphilus]|uniref:ribosomal protein S18-alanine N-acetyltransferase n=1 Tax=Dethiobacter alkaliphilus TaxID=427926 RepID=UPI0022268E9B|nr:ribosomal protein S18-alanine N-acetyltransferase [Dethiobacter alkaliphilus]MCW3490540.1 ribosomal protein S18-alanine N-acetyltransferase [Dethiobacter alkaliphilus]
MTIEPMKFSHVDRVAQIEKMVYRYPWTRHAFAGEVVDNSFASYYVAVEDDEVVGYAGIWIILDEAHVTNLAVCPTRQNRGVGQMLLYHLIKVAREKGALRMTLEVRFSNRKAQDLYKKFGFVSCGVRPNYYRDEDAMIMWLEDLQRGHGFEDAEGQP